MALNLSKTVVDILKSHPEQYFTARELAEEVLNLKPEECSEKMNRSKATVVPINNKETLLNQLVAEIGSYKKRIQNISSNETHSKYFFKCKNDSRTP